MAVRFQERQSASTVRSGGYLQTGYDFRVGSGSHFTNMKKEPTYKLSPDDQFPSQRSKNIIKEVLEQQLKDKKYNAEECNKLCKDLANMIKNRVKASITKPNDRFKIVSFVTIGEKNGASLNFSSRCVWNSKYDTYEEHNYSNGSLYAIGLVYGIYAE